MLVCLPVNTPRPRPADDASPSLTSVVLDQLRDDIVAGALAPGEKLRLEHLTSRYGCGRTPLREACSRLAAEGLVLASEQRGFRVAPISRDDLNDLTLTRQRIETLALRDAIARGDQAWEARVVAALARLAGITRQHRGIVRRDWEEAHRELHTALLSACGSPWLLRFHALLYDQSERYRRLSERADGDARDVDREHELLVAATLGRDAERAAARLTEHLAKTKDRALEGHPTLAAPSARAERAVERPGARGKMSTKRVQRRP